MGTPGRIALRLTNIPCLCNLQEAVLEHQEALALAHIGKLPCTERHTPWIPFADLTYPVRRIPAPVLWRFRIFHGC